MSDLTQTEKAIIGAAVQKAAKEAGMINPLDAKVILDRVRITDDGFVYGEDKAIAELKAERPHYFRADAPPLKVPAARRAAPNGPQQDVPGHPEPIKQKSGFEMSPEEIIKANRESKIWREATQ
jgi:hypothetical protein